MSSRALSKDQFKDHPYANQIEFVPTEHLDKFREYDREVEPGHADIKSGVAWEEDKTHLDALTEDIAKNGIQHPGFLIYGQKDRRAIIGEGNHRLAAAKRLGIPAVPMRVIRQSSLRGAGRPVPGAEENEHGYVKGDMKPSEIGMPTHDFKDQRS